jgi:adenylate cyclase
MTTLIYQHNGKVLDSQGDNLLAEFVSVVDAVQCAVAVQKEFQARNVETPESRRMEFRIGINLGDVIEEKERIYGDGVNIAARLEGLAKPGGICISKTAFDHIESKLPYGYEYLGDQTVKNIAKPVGAYHVLMEPRVTVAGKRAERKEASARRMPVLVGVFAVLVLAVAVGVWQFYIRRPSVEPASVDRMALPLPDKPSIAVLPFDNLSGDPDQEYFGDGLSEAIITALSYTPELFVIARNSSFVYKGKPVKIQQVAEDLGVQYVLEGSFQKSGDRLRITAQLIDAITGHHLWADRYDRELKDIFALQDEIIQKILTSIRVKLTEGEQARLLSKSTSNLKVYLKHLQATEISRQYSPDSNVKAREMWEETIEIDPEFSLGYTELGWTYLNEVWFGWSKSPEKSMEMAVEFAQKALDLDESSPDAHILMGSIFLGKRQYDKAITWGKRAVSLSPNSAGIMATLAIILNNAEKPEEAIPFFKKAIRLNPFPPAWYLNSLGWAYKKAGQYEDSIRAVKRALTINPKMWPAHLSLISLYSRLGRDSEAKAAVKEFLSLYPEFRITESLTKRGFDKNRAHTDDFIAEIRKAGLK